MNNAAGIPLNCGTFVGSGVPTYTFKKRNLSGDIFYIETNPTIRTISPATSGLITNQDVIFVSTSGASTITDYAINVIYTSTDYTPVTVYSSNSGVLTINNGYGSGVSPGTATIVGNTGFYYNSLDVNVTQTTGLTSTSFNSYTSGSLSKHCSDAVDNRILNKNPLTAKSIFSTQNHASGIYVRNTGCWASDLDLTSISPWNSTGGHTRAGTLISPRHIIFAAHYQINNGATIRFIDNDNNVISRTMVNKLTHPNYTLNHPDLTVGVLDSDVPSTIKFAKILPNNWADYLPQQSAFVNFNLYYIPCLVLDQEEKALIRNLQSLGTKGGFIGYAVSRNPTETNRSPYSEGLIGGDSGNPIFLLINDELVIITVVTYGDGTGTSIVYHIDAINTMMNTLGGGYQLTEVDLSGFTDFS